MLVIASDVTEVLRRAVILERGSGRALSLFDILSLVTRQRSCLWHEMQSEEYQISGLLRTTRTVFAAIVGAG
jgi:hypothetical protein